MKKLDSEEKEIVESFERGEWRSLPKSQRKKYQKIAKLNLIKDKRINIRIPSRILEDLQTYAMEEGIPYQTFIASILYKFITGRLTENKRGSVK